MTELLREGVPTRAVSIREAALLLGVHHVTIRRMIASGRLRSVVLKKGHRIPMEVLDEFLAGAA